MKKFLRYGLFLLFTGLLSSGLFAQKGLKLGVFALPNVSYLLNDDDAANLESGIREREYLPGMGGGLVLGWNPTGGFGFRLGAAYVEQGVRFTVRDIDRGIGVCSNQGDRYACDVFQTRLGYLKVPLMLGFEGYAPQNKYRFVFYLGPQLNYLVRADISDNDTDFTPPPPPNFTSIPDAYEQYEALTFSAVADIGFDVYLDDAFTLNLHLRGDYSLDDLENKDATFRRTEGGITVEQPFYDPARDETHGLLIGLLIGVTYNLSAN